MRAPGILRGSSKQSVVVDRGGDDGKESTGTTAAEGEGLGWILQRAVFTFEIPSGGRGGLCPPRRLGYFGLGIQGPGGSGEGSSTPLARRGRHG